MTEPVLTCPECGSDRVQELGTMLRENRCKRIVELEAQLEAIGAGGVEPLRRRECLHQISEPAGYTVPPGYRLQPLSEFDAMCAAQSAREQHPDDDAVDALAKLMKAKLAKQRTRGYGGWDATTTTQQRLSDMLRAHVDKGDPVDVANFCAFLAARGEGIAQAAPACKDSTPQQGEPVGEVVSASCDHATVRWLHQTSSVGGGDPRNSRAWPKVSGVSRDEGHSRALLVFFAAEPTDDEVRAVHDTLAAASTTKPAPQPLPASHGNVTEVLDIPDQCPYSGPSSHRDVWLAGWYAARKQARRKP